MCYRSKNAVFEIHYIDLYISSHTREVSTVAGCDKIGSAFEADWAIKVGDG